MGTKSEREDSNRSQLMRIPARCLVVLVLIATTTSAGCTIALGTAYPAKPEHTADRLQLDVLACQHEAEMGWASFGHQTAQFFLWPFSIPWERSNKRNTWQRCMADRGYRVEKPGGGPANVSQTAGRDVASASSSSGDVPPAAERCSAIKDVDAYIACLHGETKAPPQPPQANTTSDAELCASLRCPDGSPGLWIGQAKSLGLTVGIHAYMCATSATRVEGQWNCLPTTTGVGCVTDGGLLVGTINGLRISIQSDNLPGGRVTSCRFDGSRTAPLTLVGDYGCSGAVGEVKGTFELRRCP